MNPYRLTAAGEILRIIQISDCHVSANRDASYRGQCPDQNLASLIPGIRKWQPDLVLLTGDVSEDASSESYRRTADCLRQIPAPLLALPGNHDEPQTMRDSFPQGPWDGPFTAQVGDWQLVLLDSTVPGKVSGRLDDGHLSALQTLADRGDTSYTLVALHHQPVPVRASWIDRYPLEDAGRLLSVIDKVSGVRCVVWGHVHQDYREERNGVHLLGGPSSVANSLPRTDRFTLDPAGPACRWLELSVDGRLKTGALGVPGQSLDTGRSNHKMM